MGFFNTLMNSIFGASDYTKRQWQMQDNVFAHQSQEALMALQHSYNMRQWKASNEYNHPAAQMTRLSEAGLNPHLYASGGVGAGGAASQPSPVGLGQSHLSGQPSQGVSALDNAMKALTLFKARAELKLINSQVQNMAHQNEFVKEQTQKTALENSWERFMQQHSTNEVHKAFAQPPTYHQGMSTEQFMKDAMTYANDTLPYQVAPGKDVKQKLASMKYRELFSGIQNKESLTGLNISSANKADADATRAIQDSKYIYYKLKNELPAQVRYYNQLSQTEKAKRGLMSAQSIKEKAMKYALEQSGAKSGAEKRQIEKWLDDFAKIENDRLVLDYDILKSKWSFDQNIYWLKSFMDAISGGLMPAAILSR